MAIITLYEKAAAIAAKLEWIDRSLMLRPGEILRKASVEEIDFYYDKICKGNGGYENLFDTQGM